MQFLSLSHIDEVISSFPMESPEPFSYFHPFHCNIYIYYELNEFLWFFILFPVFFWCDYNTTAPHICQYIFTFYFIIFFLLLFNFSKFHNIYIYLMFFWLFIQNKHFLDTVFTPVCQFPFAPHRQKRYSRINNCTFETQSYFYFLL